MPMRAAISWRDVRRCEGVRGFGGFHAACSGLRSVEKDSASIHLARKNGDVDNKKRPGWARGGEIRGRRGRTARRFRRCRRRGPSSVASLSREQVRDRRLRGTPVDPCRFRGASDRGPGMEAGDAPHPGSAGVGSRGRIFSAQPRRVRGAGIRRGLRVRAGTPIRRTGGTFPGRRDPSAPIGSPVGVRPFHGRLRLHGRGISAFCFQFPCGRALSGNVRGPDILPPSPNGRAEAAFTQPPDGGPRGFR